MVDRLALFEGHRDCHLIERWRIRLATFRMICDRLAGDVLRQAANLRSAAVSASSGSSSASILRLRHIRLWWLMTRCWNLASPDIFTIVN
jgi:hypothetical protein